MRLLATLSLLFLGACNTAPMTNIETPKFIETFKVADEANKSELIKVIAAEAYLYKCCGDAEQITELLEGNGFKVRVISRTSDPHIFEDAARELNLKNDDVFIISGVRNLTFFTLDPKRYEVRTTLNANGISSASAYIRKPPVP